MTTVRMQSLSCRTLVITALGLSARMRPGIAPEVTENMAKSRPLMMNQEMKFGRMIAVWMNFLTLGRRISLIISERMMGTGKPHSSLNSEMMMLFLNARWNATREKSFSKISRPRHAPGPVTAL